MTSQWTKPDVEQLCRLCAPELDERQMPPFVECVLSRLLSGERPLTAVIECLLDILRPLPGAVSQPTADDQLKDELEELCRCVSPPSTTEQQIGDLVSCIIMRITRGERVIAAIVGCLLGGAVTPPVPPPPPPPPPPNGGGSNGVTVDAWNALGRLSVDGIGCTGTVLERGRRPGQYLVLTAWHCLRGTSGRGTLTMRDGVRVNVTALVADQQADILLMRADTDVALRVAQLAASWPQVGTPCWHGGWGVAAPGQRKAGSVSGGVDANGMIRMTVAASGGDSGGGIFRSDTDHLFSVVCCGSSNTLWGGTTPRIHALLARVEQQDYRELEGLPASDLAPYIPTIPSELLYDGGYVPTADGF